MKTIEVQEVIDAKRGCGWRKPGGIYLRCDAPGEPCGKLPLPLSTCPCCNAGIKPARGWTWFQPGPLFKDAICALEGPRCCSCVCGNSMPLRAGLLWIGEKFYPTPAAWLEEAKFLGVSRRIAMLPKGFEAGKTWVYAAHRKCIELPRVAPSKDCWICEGTGSKEDRSPCDCTRNFQPGIFHVFKPTRVEYVCRGDETQEQLEALVKRGLTPVKVRRDGDLKLDDKTFP